MKPAPAAARRRARVRPRRHSCCRAARGPCAPAARPARVRRRCIRTPRAAPGSRGPDQLVFVVEPLANGHDRDLVDGAGRPLRRRIEAAQRLDHVADELEPHRLDVAGGKHIDDAAADGERAVLVDRVLAREAGVNEQIGERLRVDFGARPDLERRRSRRPAG